MALAQHVQADPGGDRGQPAAPVNSTSIAFHAAMGFTVTGPVGDYDGPDSAKMLFERRL
jgi:predicted GNAT superfamily acetyltransferase